MSKDNYTADIAALVQQLEHHDAAKREQAARALAALGRQATVAAPAVTAALTDQTPAVRAAAAWALSKIGGDETAVPALIRGLTDPDPNVRFCSARGLVAIKPSPIMALAALMEALGAEERYAVSDSVRWALQVIGPASVAPLREALHSTEPRLRRRAVAALASSSVERAHVALPVLLEALVHEDAAVRMLAAQALGETSRQCREDAAGLRGAWAQVPQALSERLTDEDAAVRERAAWALMWLGSAARSIADQLEVALRESDPATQRWVADALNKIRSSATARQDEAT